MNPFLCTAPHCWAPTLHRTDCPGEDCRGCLPRLAADGVKLCRPHTERLRADAIRCAELHRECALALISTSTGIGGGVNPQPGLDLNDHAAEARTLIRHRLVAWSKYISDERGIKLPQRPGRVPGERVLDERTEALAGYIAHFSVWLAANKLAGAASEELAEAAALGNRAAYPVGSRIVGVGKCPITAPEVCPGDLRAMLREATGIRPSRVVCDANDTHAWDSSEWLDLGSYMHANQPPPPQRVKVGSTRAGRGGWTDPALAAR